MKCLFGLNGLPTKDWYRWKARTLGMKPVKFDPYKEEGGCIICGRHELVFPLSGVVHLCSKCFENSLVARDTFGENVRWKRHIALNIFVQHTCDACGRRIRSGEFYYTILNGRLCTKCCWKKLGGHSSRLSIFGDHMW